MKTKVETSILQIPVGSLKGVSSVAITSSAQGSSGCSTIVPYSPQGPSRCTRSKQKTIIDPVERERRARPYSFFSHPSFSSSSYAFI